MCDAVRRDEPATAFIGFCALQQHVVSQEQRFSRRNSTIAKHICYIIMQFLGRRLVTAFCTTCTVPKRLASIGRWHGSDLLQYRAYSKSTAFFVRKMPMFHRYCSTGIVPFIGLPNKLIIAVSCVGSMV